MDFLMMADMLGIAKIPPALSLGATFAILAVGVAVSLRRTRDEVPVAQVSCCRACKW